VEKAFEAVQSLHKAHAQLLQAAKDGDAQKVASFLKIPDVDANCKDDIWYKTPLMYAAKRGHTEVVWLLLKAGLTPEQINSKELLLDRTALMYALNGGHESIARLIAGSLPPDDLITHDRYDVQSTSEYACNAQMRALLFSYMTHENFDLNLPTMAAFYNDISLIEDMIKKGFVSELGRSFALHSAAQEGHEKIVTLLLEVGASVDAILKRDKTGKNALMWAACHGHSKIVSLLLKQGLSIEQVSCPTSWGETALVMACKYGHTKVVSCLLACGLSDEQIQFRNKEYDDGYRGNTALECAALAGYQEIVDLLFSALGDSFDRAICFRAIAAAAKNDTTSLQKLLDDPNSSLEQIMGPDPHGRTALIAATQKGHSEIVSQLLHAGITSEQVSLQDCNGRTALHYACDESYAYDENEYTSIVKMLTESGLSTEQINLADKDGWTPLINAASWKHTNSVKLLLERGLTSEHINIQNSDGGTALMWAIQYLNKEEYYKDNTEIVQLLISYLTPEQLSVQDWQKQTALFHAAYEDRTDIVTLLLEHLAPDQILLACDDGRTALDVGFESQKTIQIHLDNMNITSKKENI